MHLCCYVPTFQTIRPSPIHPTVPLLDLVHYCFRSTRKSNYKMSSPTPSPPLQSEAHEAPTVPTEPKKASPEEVAGQVLDAHQACLFHATSYLVTARDLIVPESFFEPTTAELTHAMHTYSAHSERLRNATMKTKKMRDAEQKQRMARFRQCLLRIHFPDRVSLQGVFTPHTTLRQVVRFVRAALKHARDVKFHLFVVPPKRVLTQLDATLWEENLVPGAVLHLAIDDGPTVTTELLKETLLANITDAPVRSAQPENTTDAKQGDLSSDNADKPADLADDSKAKAKAKAGATRKIPKWFKK